MHIHIYKYIPMYIHIYTYIRILIAGNPPPPGGFLGWVVPWSRAVCKRFHDKMRPSHLVVKSLTHGSWSGNIVNRKPPPGGGFLSINLHMSIHKTASELNFNMLQSTSTHAYIPLSTRIYTYVYMYTWNSLGAQFQHAPVRGSNGVKHCFFAARNPGQGLHVQRSCPQGTQIQTRHKNVHKRRSNAQKTPMCLLSAILGKVSMSDERVRNVHT